jgi:dihydroneopterin aldolase
MKIFDEIIIQGLKATAIIGILDWERETKQNLIFDIKIECDVSKAIQTEDVAFTLDYAKVSADVIDYVQNSNFQLIETLSEKVAELILSDLRVESVDIKLDKGKIVEGVDSVGIRIKRNRHWMLNKDTKWT